ncbi:MAG: DUF2283 domain-containing protein [bacterium]
MKKIKYDKDVDILLIELNDSPVDYAEESGDMIIHYSKEGTPVILEVMDAKKFSFNMFDSIINNREVSFA